MRWKATAAVSCSLMVPPFHADLQLKSGWVFIGDGRHFGCLTVNCVELDLGGGAKMVFALLL